MSRYDDILKRVDELVETEFVTAKFGTRWRTYAKENMDIDGVIDIAWRQGRRAILLERALQELLNE